MEPALRHRLRHHAPPAKAACLGSHMGIDATRKLPSEGYTRTWPELLRMERT